MLVTLMRNLVMVVAAVAIVGYLATAKASTHAGTALAAGVSGR